MPAPSRRRPPRTLYSAASYRVEQGNEEGARQASTECHLVPRLQPASHWPLLLASGNDRSPFQTWLLQSATKLRPAAPAGLTVTPGPRPGLRPISMLARDPGSTLDVACRKEKRQVEECSAARRFSRFLFLPRFTNTSRYQSPAAAAEQDGASAKSRSRSQSPVAVEEQQDNPTLVSSPAVDCVVWVIPDLATF